VLSQTDSLVCVSVSAHHGWLLVGRLLLVVLLLELQCHYRATLLLLLELLQWLVLLLKLLLFADLLQLKLLLSADLLQLRRRRRRPGRRRRNHRVWHSTAAGPTAVTRCCFLITMAFLCFRAAGGRRATKVSICRYSLRWWCSRRLSPVVAKAGCVYREGGAAKQRRQPREEAALELHDALPPN
jgi:hypothetical protein